jgi:hypothetical protein
MSECCKEPCTTVGFGLEGNLDAYVALAIVTRGRHPGVRDVAQYFTFDHLPEGPLRETSKAVCQLAASMIASLPDSPQLTIGLQRLLDAKDAFVRAALHMDAPHGGD